MTNSLRRAWEAAGEPWKLAQPIADLAATLKKRGYTVGTIGNDAHLDDDPAEDHAPYSETGWPNANPYPYVHALDIMPPLAGRGLPTLAQLAAQIRADRQAGVAGIGWLKYMNSTDAHGVCVHDSWQPNYAQRASGDVGHIHLSCRTDFTYSPAGAQYDPVARVIHGVAPAPESTSKAPPYPGGTFRYVPGARLVYSSTVKTWQARMHALGLMVGLDVDGLYGPRSAAVCRTFQAAHGLAADAILGPLTWRASWT